jgi:hypothetical protein
VKALDLASVKMLLDAKSALLHVTDVLTGNGPDGQNASVSQSIETVIHSEGLLSPGPVICDGQVGGSNPVTPDQKPALKRSNPQKT